MSFEAQENIATFHARKISTHIIIEKLHITELAFKLHKKVHKLQANLAWQSTIPSGRKKGQDLYVQKKVVCPQKAACQDREEEKKLA